MHWQERPRAVEVSFHKATSSTRWGGADRFHANKTIEWRMSGVGPSRQILRRLGRIVATDFAESFKYIDAKITLFQYDGIDYFSRPGVQPHILDILERAREAAMKFTRRHVLRLGAASPVAVRSAWASDYPTRPVRVVVGFPPGGFTDTSTRLIAAALSERLGQQFVVENRPGASSNIATEFVVRAAPDGYTLLQIGDGNAYNATLYDNLNFDFIRDIAPVASTVNAPFVLVVNPSFGAKTVPEFIKYAKANPGKINVGSLGPGSPSQLIGVLFKSMVGIDLVTVNYRGIGPALTDLMNGRIEVVFTSLVSVIGYIKADKLRALGVTTARRVDLLPDVPALGEFVPGYEAAGWVGLGAPAKTPPEIIATLNAQVNTALADPAFKARLVEIALEPFPSSQTDFAKFIVEFTDKWQKVIRAANIKPE
jgi:tripartite-type tricarboxylate transporter receptor subunit TctC